MIEGLFSNPWILAIVGILFGFKLRIIPLCIITAPVAIFVGYHLLNPLPEMAALLSGFFVMLGVIFLASMWVTAGVVRLFTLRKNTSQVANKAKQTLFR